MKHVCMHGQPATNTGEEKRLHKASARRWFIRVCEQTCDCRNNNSKRGLNHCTSCVCWCVLCFGKTQNIPGWTALRFLPENSSHLWIRWWPCQSFAVKKQEARTWKEVDRSQKLDATVLACIKNGNHLHIWSRKMDFPAFTSCFDLLSYELHSTPVHITLQ